MPADPLANAAQTVQLLHQLPDGSRHIDWMLDLDPLHEARLVTFRLEQRVDQLPPGRTLELERIADHRRAYLTYEGPISDDRGHVRRVAAGTIEAVQSVGDVWAFLIVWHGPSPAGGRGQRLRLWRRPDGRWHVSSLAS